MTLVPALAASLMLVAGPALAQHAGHHGHAGGAPGSSYAGLETRAVKALSDTQVADLKAGRGMGLAVPAELNGYPGPSHVLELAEALALAPGQRARLQGLFDAMQAEAVPLGERVIAGETELDRLFAERRAAPANVAAATAAIGVAQGELRAAHLRYHLATAEVLTPPQVDHYSRLRGYAAR
ncbi:periplasmic heavy metal sensor [Salinarimonas soli]|uniref:Periplasmic heavy metal sensor n=1 Tax=Salinarimonas soli TaxID=1638099 RepID=A0A5B2V951_9HYPH|nr:periplasmic heavy metal sensor [Salinarimonas soli]KAA2236023.1 periplasmic heavy metal sensor [Salinarimonas soli]